MTIKLVLIASPLTMEHPGVIVNSGWLGIGIICRCEATCLPADSCFSELAACWSSTKLHVYPRTVVSVS
jgi:hypothetical protein